MTSIQTESDLHAAFAQLKQAFASEPYPDLQQRLQQLDALQQALVTNEQALCQAVDTDFSGRSHQETLMADLFSSVQAIGHSRRHLRSWLRPERRPISWLFMPARNYVVYQPKGVVGIIVPWNYPIQLAIAPLQAALAAGNRVLLKLSEDTPATNACLSQLLSQCFSSDQVRVVEGDLSLAQAFSALPWDHLFFTGSTAVGRKVLQAAAVHLTPVTLELGGKSPVILAPDANLALAAERLCFAKSLNAGQTCIAPDYVLLPEASIKEFKQAYQQAFARMYPSLADNADYSSIINDRQHQRLLAWLDEAKQAGAVLTPMADAKLPGRKLAPVLVESCPGHCQLMQEEIFGPWLPLVGYQTLAEATGYVQARPKPLALYLFSQDADWLDTTLHQVAAGGVTVNDAILHVAQEDLPFGGIGPSGMGSYHGREGFLTFSHAKGVHHRGRWSATSWLYPPYPQWLAQAIRRLMR